MDERRAIGRLAVQVRGDARSFWTVARPVTALLDLADVRHQNDPITPSSSRVNNGRKLTP